MAARSEAWRSLAWVLAVALSVVVAGVPEIRGEEPLDLLLDDSEEQEQDKKEAKEPEEARKPEERKREPEKAEPERGKVEAVPRPVIEEIVVTAQKREERLHEVPISMTVLDSDFLDQANITDLRDASLYIPNVKVDFVGFGVVPRMRGFATRPQNKGFEQAVGLVVDGIPYTRGEYFQGAIFDVEQIEALRGPQGHLFGKNSTVGLLNLTTKNPTDELAGYLNAELGEIGRRQFAGALGGPVIQGFLNVRVAGLIEERDGIIRNTTAAIVPGAPETFQDRTRDGIRAKLDFPNLLGVNLLLTYERANFDIQGSGAEVVVMPEEIQDFFREFDPNADFVPANFVTSEDFPWLQTRALDTFSARAGYDLAGWGLEALGGFSRLDVGTSFADNAPAFILDGINDDLSKQTTFELRLTSPNLAGFFGLERVPGFLGELLDVPLGWTDFTAGFFFQRRKLDPVDFVGRINDPVLLRLIMMNNNPAQESLPPPAELAALLAEEEYVETLSLLFLETSDSYDGFGQMNWHFADRWTLLHGMRLAFNRKNGFWDSRNAGPDGSPESAVIINSQNPGFTEELSRDELKFTPKVGMKYDWTDDIGLFATWATSFRGGGFNTSNAKADPKFRVFDAESVRSWEVGAKMRLLEGAMNLNVGLYRMLLTDFQFFTIDPTAILPSPYVDNAGDLRAQGVEADVTYFADWLTIRGALGFNDTEFLKFRFGPCSLDRQNTDGDSDSRCDLTGGPLARAPKWNITVTPSIRYPLSSIPGLGVLWPNLAGVDLRSGVTVEYQDTQLMNETLDPRTRQGSFFRLNANFGFENVDQGWSLHLTVQNLTNEVTVSNTAEGITQCSGCLTSDLEDPRLVFGGLRWEF